MVESSQPWVLHLLSFREGSDSCDLSRSRSCLAEKLLGFGHFCVPLAELFRRQEPCKSVSNFVAIFGDLSHQVFFGGVGVLLPVLFHFFVSFTQEAAELLLLFV